MLTFFLAAASVLLLAFVALHLHAFGGLWIDGLRLKKRLQKSHRVISFSEAREQLQRNHGIVIVDSPTLGWGIDRIWWSPVMDFQEGVSERGKDRFSSPADHFHYDRFISEEAGVALLISGFVWGYRVRGVLMNRLGLRENEFLFVFSGGVLFDREGQRRNLQRNADGDSL